MNSVTLFILEWIDSVDPVTHMVFFFFFFFLNIRYARNYFSEITRTPSSGGGGPEFNFVIGFRMVFTNLRTPSNVHFFVNCRSKWNF